MTADNMHCVVREIGRGAFGIVEEVRRTDGMERSVARKRLLPEALADPGYVRRFKREVRLLQGLEHPGIVKILDSDLNSDTPWFTMPIAESTLARDIQLSGSFDEERTDLIFEKVLDAIGYAHSAGVIHRDLKPHNILLIDDEPVVSDFGLGRDIDSDSTALTTSGGVGGTWGYVAPEQWTGTPIDERADIYALGSLLFEMTTRRNPIAFSANDVPSRYRYIVNRSRVHDPNARYASVAELSADFARLR